MICVEVIQQYYGLVLLLEIVWKLVGNVLDFFFFFNLSEATPA